jgi:hypothetical protein
MSHVYGVKGSTSVHLGESFQALNRLIFFELTRLIHFYLYFLCRVNLWTWWRVGEQYCTAWQRAGQILKLFRVPFFPWVRFKIANHELIVSWLLNLLGLVRERELSNRGCHKAVPLPARPGFVSAIPVIKPFCWPKKGVHPCISNFIRLLSSIIPWHKEKGEDKMSAYLHP